MNGSPRLNYQRHQRGDDNGAHAKLVNFDVRFAADIKRGESHIEVHKFRVGAKLVNFDVRFAADIKRVVHRFAAVGGYAAAAGFCSFFISSGRSERRTRTSSRRSRFAAGLMRICLKGLPDLISATVPTGRSRGKMRSMPLVMTRSPRFTVSSFGTYFMTSSGSPCPPTGLWMRESASIAPTPLSLSVRRSTCDAFG